MKQTLLSIALATLFFNCAALGADDLAALAGKWSIKKVNDDGQAITQTLEIKNNKFTFQVKAADNHPTLYAEGEVKLEKFGPLSSAKFFHIRGGDSASNLDDVDDEYICVYVLDGDTWTLAVNFDKQRERQKPSADVYRRAKAAAAK